MAASEAQLTLPDALTRTSQEMLRPSDQTQAAASTSRAPGHDAAPRASGLEAISNMEPGFQAARRIVVAVDGTVGAAAAVQWAVQQIWRPGDALHLVHSVCCLLPKLEIYHSGPGNAFAFEQPEEHHERKDVLAAQSFIKETFVPMMEAMQVPYDVHLFVDTRNAPPEAIGGTVLRVFRDLGAALLVTTADCYGDAEQAFSPVAQWLVAQQEPVVFVRPPLAAAALDEAQDPSDAASAAAAALSEAPDTTLSVV